MRFCEMGHTTQDSTVSHNAYSTSRPETQEVAETTGSDKPKIHSCDGSAGISSWVETDADCEACPRELRFDPAIFRVIIPAIG